MSLRVLTARNRKQCGCIAKSIHNVSFVGIGNMGLPMAKNLVETGASVIVYDSSRKASAKVSGARIAESLEEIAFDPVDIIFTMLPGKDALDSVMKHLGALEIPANTCFVDCSTVSPSTSRHWNEFWNERGICMIDAPVSGGVKGAQEAALSFLVGCRPRHEERFEKVIKPILLEMGKNVIHCGNAGAGSATKLCNNLALATQMIGIAEALALGDALGVDPVILTDAINQSTAACWSSKFNNPHPEVAQAWKNKQGVIIPSGLDYTGGFASELMLKDLGLAQGAAKEQNLELNLSQHATEMYSSIVADGRGGKDFGVIYDTLRETKNNRSNNKDHR